MNSTADLIRRVLGPALALPLLWLSSLNDARAQHDLVTIDRFVPHASTVPANKGQRVGLFVHEKLDASLAAEIEAGAAPEGRVVLFVHGNSVPSVPDFDLAYRDYSWMAHLADAGFDAFAMDHTGYGYSPRPTMDDPCNLDAENRALIEPRSLTEACSDGHERALTNSDSDWDEIDSVVDYIRALRGVERLSLIGWSRGGPRAGGYAARHPDKIDKLILYAPAYDASAPSSPPSDVPSQRPPMTLQTYDALMHDRWQSGVACENQVDPKIRATIWQTIMSFDALGSVWRPEGVMRVRISDYWGWNEAYAAKIQAPTLIMTGRQDSLLPSSNVLYDDLTGTDSRVLVTMECATHFAVWEASQYRFMHEASTEWLTTETFRGRSQGTYRAEAATR
jgi:pimeloyl-ACP methyl ester carboxylesterase